MAPKAKPIPSEQIQDDPFLPDDYERPKSGGNFLIPSKLNEGDNRLRFLSKAIFGSVGWTQNGDDRSPVRKHMGEDFAPGEVIVDAKNRIRHFWAMFIWNYSLGQIQVFEITQSTIQEAIENLAKNTRWGSPLGYDICINKTGSDLETKYKVLPEPKTPLDPEIVKTWSERPPHWNLEALYAGGDPFDWQLPEGSNGKPDEKSPEARGLARFWVLLGELVKLGIYNESIKANTPESRVERRKITATLLGSVKEPHQMTADDWAVVNNKLDLMKKQHTPPNGDDSDIPF